jgi:hypothetical protein
VPFFKAETSCVSMPHILTLWPFSNKTLAKAVAQAPVPNIAT